MAIPIPNGATEFVQGYLSTSLSAQHQTIILRGDSGFATPDLMETLEGNNIFYTIRLKSNPRLKRMALDGRYVNLDNLLMIEGQLTTDEFEYQAASWDKARRVIVLNDEHGGTQFIVTNLSLLQKDIVRVYRKVILTLDSRNQEQFDGLFWRAWERLNALWQ